MVFSSPIFLFLFLPAFLAVYFAVAQSWRNGVLVFASLIFYAWGEGERVFVLIGLILANWAFGLALERASTGRGRRSVLVLAIGFNLCLIGYFKYFAFLVTNLDPALTMMGASALPVPRTRLLLGISFITFHALSYLIDVYRGTAPAQRRLTTFGMYISMFPQLIAGPIIRYHDIADQLDRRSPDIDKFASGCERFIIGLGKKVLIANPLGALADRVFALPHDQLSTQAAWVGLIAYTLQIYFDFSGYSDMAIGLARMIGFDFLENFDYPYISRSIHEFWRRWHISLSRWFRDYLYIPLGGNRVSRGLVYRNLVVVFLLCGLWHGAAWTFIIWGMIHGAFLVVERMGFARVLDKLPAVLRHVYVLSVVMLGWVFFRSDTLGDAVSYLTALVGVGAAAPKIWPVSLLVDREVLTALGLALVGSTPLFAFLTRDWRARRSRQPGDFTAIVYVSDEDGAMDGMLRWFRLLANTGILILAASDLAAGTYNPFIYFRF